ncbi:uracil-DNA glycosylase [Roseovarius tibetensis]|uniref:uracil-DNA glycosylase n=1 Tax=Roseovarius tibetensis TaxID=2685897 RepID=UPI003D7F6EEB
MTGGRGIDAFIDRLAATEAPLGCVNPYTVCVQGVDAGPEAPQIRRRQLAAYLRRRCETARLMLVAEAPGYQGARFSGIAMTCERTLLGHKPGVPAEAVLGPDDKGTRTSHPETGRNGPEKALGFSEPTASIVWRELVALGLTDHVVLWNVFPFHPYRAGVPLTNRTPSHTDVAAHLDILTDLHSRFPAARVICIGNTARDHLRPLAPDLPTLRHPANGGASKFRAGLRDLVSAIN